MRDPKRINRLMNILQYYWFNKVPDWRFGQLISNLESAVGRDIFYMEDEDFIELIKMYFGDVDQWTQEDWDKEERIGK